MKLGLVGRKCGMTRIFQEDGSSLPITVIHFDNNIVSQVKTEGTDGYSAIQVTAGTLSRNKLTKPLAGHFEKANVEPGDYIGECRLSAEELGNYQVGDTLDVSMFAEGQRVDVTGTSKGKGFQGTVKRHNFNTQDATHGNSLAHRRPGSTGQNQSPGRVFKNKKMAGHMGDERKTMQSLEVVRVDAEQGLLMVKGGIPGASGGRVFVTHAVKSTHE